MRSLCCDKSGFSALRLPLSGICFKDARHSAVGPHPAQECNQTRWPTHTPCPWQNTARHVSDGRWILSLPFGGRWLGHLRFTSGLRSARFCGTQKSRGLSKVSRTTNFSCSVDSRVFQIKAAVRHRHHSQNSRAGINLNLAYYYSFEPSD
jgi:hypothetical protein